MATLAVLKFDSASGADQALQTLQDLQREQLIQVVDAAVVSWPVGTRSRRPASSRTWPASAPLAARSGASCSG